MKSKLPFKTTLRLAMQGKTVTKIMTVFLCAFSFALVGLATMGVFYNESDVMAKALLHYMKNERHELVFSYFNEVEQNNYIPLKLVERIQEETGLDFVQCYDYSLYEVPGYFYHSNSDLVSQSVDLLSASDEAYEACGAELIAGRFAETIDEIAIPLELFEAFRQNGYAYNIQNYVYIEDGVLYTDFPYTFSEKLQSYVFSYGGTVDYIDVDEEGWFYIGMETAENQKIETYDDIIGKEFVFFGDPATGSMGNESLYSVKVSGIVDVGGANFIRRSPYAILHSVAWRETFWSTLKDKVRYMTQVPAVDHDLARTCADLTMEMIDEYVEIYPEARDRNLISVGVEGITGLVDPTLPNYYNFWAGHKAYVFLGAVSGAFFGIFSVLLCWHLMTSMLAVQRIKIGILRSLGAGEKDVVKIVLLFAFILSVFTFLLSLAFTLAGYYGFLYPAFYTPKWGVSEFFFTGWTVLILAGLSFGVPLLCSIVPLRKFLKKSIVDNISGNIRAR